MSSIKIVTGITLVSVGLVAGLVLIIMQHSAPAFNPHGINAELNFAKLAFNPLPEYLFLSACILGGAYLLGNVKNTAL